MEPFPMELRTTVDYWIGIDCAELSWPGQGEAESSIRPISIRGITVPPPPCIMSRDLADRQPDEERQQTHAIQRAVQLLLKTFYLFH